MGKTAEDDEYMAAEAAAMKVGDRCVVSLTVGATKGKVQYVGKIPTIGKGWWIGVQYDGLHSNVAATTPPPTASTFTSTATGMMRPSARTTAQ